MTLGTGKLGTLLSLPGYIVLGGYPMPTWVPVVPTNWQTNRADIQSALLAMVAAFQTAYPGFVNQAWSSRPAGLADFPAVFIGDITETLAHDSGTRQTVFEGTLIYVDTMAESDETQNRTNVFLDYMRDLFTANARVFVPGILEETAVSEAEDTWGASVRTTGTAIHWRFTILEGRN